MREARRVAASLRVHVLAILVLAAALVPSAGAQPAEIKAENTFASSQIRLGLTGVKGVLDAKTGRFLPAPTWTIRNPAGATVAAGKFEYG